MPELSVNSRHLKHWYLTENSFISQYSLDKFPISLCISTPVSSNYLYSKVNFLGPENLLWDISSLGWSLTLRYQELTVSASFAYANSKVSNQPASLTNSLFSYTYKLLILKFHIKGQKELTTVNFQVFGQIGLSKQWRPRPDMLLQEHVWLVSTLFAIPSASLRCFTPLKTQNCSIFRSVTVTILGVQILRTFMLHGCISWS